MSSPVDRRAFLSLAASALALGALPARAAGRRKARVVVVGGGYGGATAARYLRLWDPAIEVVLVERESAYVACPMSNLVLGSYARMADITVSYEGLRRYGVQLVRDEAVSLDPAKKVVRLARGGTLAYDRAIVSPGVDFEFGEIEGYEQALREGRVLHAWKAGAATLALRRELEQMPDGGVFVLSVPLAPFRCPPGPYERACIVASYFKQAKPRAKVLLLDANPDVTSKPELFKRAWAELYPGIVEYQPNSRAIGVDDRTRTLHLELEDVKGDVLNVVPPQRAAEVAARSGLITTNNRWCDVDWRSAESTVAPGVHVLGDATLAAPAMAKSASMANNQAKIAAAAVVAALNGAEPEPLKILNTCYSFVSEKEAIRVTSVHEWDAARRTLVPLPEATGVSAARSAAEGEYGWNWARTILTDAFG